MIKKLGHILLALAVIGVSLLVLGSPGQANPAGPSNLSTDASAPPMTTGGPANGNFTSVSATDPTIWGGLWLSNVAFRYGGKEVSPC